MTIYEQYAQTQKQIDVLEKMKESLREVIQKELPEDGFKDEMITAFWRINKKWFYSASVAVLEDKLKAAKIKVDTEKEKEEKSGIARSEEIKQLTIKVK